MAEMDRVYTHILKIVDGNWVGKIVFLIFRICVNNPSLQWSAFILIQWRIKILFSNKLFLNYKFTNKQKRRGGGKYLRSPWLNPWINKREGWANTFCLGGKFLLSPWLHPWINKREGGEILAVSLTTPLNKQKRRGGNTCCLPDYTPEYLLSLWLNPWILAVPLTKPLNTCCLPD